MYVTLHTNYKAQSKAYTPPTASFNMHSTKLNSLSRASMCKQPYNYILESAYLNPCMYPHQKNTKNREGVVFSEPCDSTGCCSTPVSIAFARNHCTAE